MQAISFHTRFCLASFFFISFGVAAIFFEIPWLMLVPFTAIISPAAIRMLILRPQWFYFLLIALLPLSTEINITPSLGFDFPDELLMALLSFTFIAVISYTPQQFPKQLLIHPLILLLTIHLAWICIACIFSQNPLLSIKFALAKSWYIIPFVVLPTVFVTNKQSIKSLALCLLLPMGFVMLQSLVRHSVYGFTFEGIKETLSPFFRNHVTYSSMLVCLLAVLWAATMLTSNCSFNKLLKGVLVLTIVALVLSYSRGALLALFTGIITWFAFKKNIVGWLIGVIIVIAVCSTIWLAINNNYLRFTPDYNTTVFHGEYREHLQATIALKDVSNAERFYRWVAAANMAVEKPITGFGPNNFYNYYRQHTATQFRTWVSENPEHSSVHNYFLLVLLEQGVPGLVLFCLLYFSMIVYSQKLYRALNDRFYKTTALTIGVILVMIGTLIFMNDLIETDKIGSLFWLCLGMLVMLSDKVSKRAIAEKQ